MKAAEIIHNLIINDNSQNVPCSCWNRVNCAIIFSLLFKAHRILDLIYFRGAKFKKKKERKINQLYVCML